MAPKKTTTKATTTALEEVEVVVTQARLDAHPEYAEQEITLGDVILLPKTEVEEYDELAVTPAAPAPKKTTTKATGDVALLDNGKFIRRYSAEDKAQAEMVAAKKPDTRSVIPFDGIKVITCEYSYLDKKNDLVHGQEQFSEEKNGPDFPEKAIAFNNEKRGSLVFVVEK